MSTRQMQQARPTRNAPARTDGRAPESDVVTEALQSTLATTFQVYRDLHLAHFNVQGPYFPQLHALFETQYNEVWQALDAVAERLRAKGALVPAKAFSATNRDLPRDALAMVEQLAADHRGAAQEFQALFDLCEENGDPVTGDLAVERARAHDQHAWMLEATAKGWGGR